MPFVIAVYSIFHWCDRLTDCTVDWFVTQVCDNSIDNSYPRHSPISADQIWTLYFAKSERHKPWIISIISLGIYIKKLFRITIPKTHETQLPRKEFCEFMGQKQNSLLYTKRSLWASNCSTMEFPSVLPIDLPSTISSEKMCYRCIGAPSQVLFIK